MIYRSLGQTELVEPKPTGIPGWESGFEESPTEEQAAKLEEYRAAKLAEEEAARKKFPFLFVGLGVLGVVLLMKK